VVHVPILDAFEVADDIILHAEGLPPTYTVLIKSLDLVVLVNVKVLEVVHSVCPDSKGGVFREDLERPLRSLHLPIHGL